MERITISLDEALAREFDALIERRGYQNRSEAMRDLIRDRLERGRLEREQLERQDNAWCIASVSYVYNHHERELAERLTEIQHEHHDLTVATLHAHLDHEHCIESVILKGTTQSVRAFADALMAERGVRHGKLNLVSVEAEQDRHTHGYAPKGKGGAVHSHLKPRS